MSIIGLAISACLISNVLLSQFLGICSFLGVSNKTDAGTEFTWNVPITVAGWS